ncbi:MAG: hypothetical protein AB7O88_18450 [Reyranellaceae bacterium]
MGPSIGGTDVFIFKDAGCNLAMGRGFDAFAIPGSPGFEPTLYASYVPGLPLVFGLYAWLFGCTAETNTWFNLAVGVLTSAVFAGIVQRVFHDSRYRVVGGFIIGLVGPLGLVGHGDRPEVLALFFFQASCFAASRATNAGLKVGALMAGMASLVHPLVGIFAAFTIGAAGLVRALPERPSLRDPTQLRSLLRLGGRIAAITVMPLLVTVAVYAALDGGGFKRFLSHAAGGDSGIKFSDGYATYLSHALFSAGIGSILLVSAYVGASILSVVAVIRVTSDAAFLRKTSAILLVASFVLVPILVFPAQNNYMRLAAISLFVLVALSPRIFGLPASGGPVLLVFAIFTLGIAGATTLLDMIPRIGARDNYESASRQLRETLGQSVDVTAGITVLDPAAAYFLYKPHFPRLISLSYLSAGQRASKEITALVGCAMGRRPDFVPATPKLLGRVGEDITTSPPVPFAPTLARVALTHSNWSWGCRVYRLR